MPVIIIFHINFLNSGDQNQRYWLCRFQEVRAYVLLSLEILKEKETVTMY